jgi:hypothetical protein
MMLNIGHIAKSYGVLPHMVLANANTYDLMIADVMSSWEEYQYNKAMGKNPVPNLTQDELKALMNKVKKHDSNGSQT